MLWRKQKQGRAGDGRVGGLPVPRRAVELYWGVSFY